MTKSKEANKARNYLNMERNKRRKKKQQEILELMDSDAIFNVLADQAFKRPEKKELIKEKKTDKYAFLHKDENVVEEKKEEAKTVEQEMGQVS